MSFVENFISTSVSVLLTGVLLLGIRESKLGGAIGGFLSDKIDSFAGRVPQIVEFMDSQN